MTTPLKRRRLQRVSSTGSFTLSDPSDEEIVTAKKVRQAPPSPRATPVKPVTLSSPGAKKQSNRSSTLPPTLSHLLQLHTALESLLALKLGSSALAPSAHPTRIDTLTIINICTSAELERAAGRRCAPAEIARLCWIYEAGVAPVAVETRPETPVNSKEQNDNPFVTPTKSRRSELEWMRGGTGITLSPMRVLEKDFGKRRTVYAFGIEVDASASGGKTGLDVASRWLSEKPPRVRLIEKRIRDWWKKNTVNPLPPFPSSTLPPLIQPANLPTPSSTRTRSLASTPVKKGALSSNTPTPTRVHKALMSDNPFMTPPETPTKIRGLPSSLPVTPAKSDGRITPTSGSSVKDRKNALFERLAAKAGTPRGTILFRDEQTEEERAFTPDELKRRSALSRLGGVAEGIYMMFSSTGGDLATPATRRRRAVPMDEAIQILVKSSKVAISEAEAQLSIKMLTELCPFFVRILVIDRAEWLEAPSSSSLATPPSPGSVAVAEMSKRSPGGSPRRVGRNEDGGLRRVRERIRRELDGPSL
ncbi:hypothetical protein DACRYDRAFT_25082 [Dacryopinax primogenitus]|uniref:DNA replication factor Cdt1 C-terminal domain-containing protein n=1 Tax=Dacryopinax primogenitus (strain DJM 731) TaxID=1858805 RepID=M5FNN9_DACPD|nr:uncharacterized protein DACRYDRAFT_25082 [Dacryopinax primogenitus]EJT97745.1 hypothetical protein DACRYDRAFT_25082 [Dacryopinax primogenitus]